MLIREVMTTAVITVRPTDPVRAAIRTLYEHNVTAAPVLDEAGRLVGIVSEMDLLRGEFDPDPRASVRFRPGAPEPPPAVVSDVMTSEVTTTTETADVASLTGVMISQKIKSVPVLRGRELVGIVSRRDLLGVLTRSDQAIRADVVALLTEQDPHGSSYSVEVRDGVVELSGGPAEDQRHLAERLTRTVPGVVRVRRSTAR
ncbi:MAG TPA: CBS domain-containing protein [Actinomycetes bacterium]|nr:CBS domain-containing protein [Actinomycetes bacterium]